MDNARVRWHECIAMGFIIFISPCKKIISTGFIIIIISRAFSAGVLKVIKNCINFIAAIHERRRRHLHNCKQWSAADSSKRHLQATCHTCLILNCVVRLLIIMTIKCSSISNATEIKLNSKWCLLIFNVCLTVWQVSLSRELNSTANVHKYEAYINLMCKKNISNRKMKIWHRIYY